MGEIERTFDEEATATKHLAGLLQRALGTDLAAGVAAQKSVLQELMIPGPSAAPAFGEIKLLTPEVMNRGLGLSWAIRDEDIKLFETVLSGVSSTAGAAALTFAMGGTMSLATAAVILGNIFVFFRRIRRKGVTLSDREFHVLRALRSSERGMTLDEIEGVMIFKNLGYGREEVEETLQELTNRRLHGGAVVALTRRAGDGRWSAVDL